MQRARAVGEGGRNGLDCSRIAAGIDDEIAALCLGARAAQRTVEQDMPGGGERLGASELVLQGQCAHFGDDPAFGSIAGGDGAGDFVESGRTGQTGKDVLGGLCYGGGTFDHLDAVLARLVDPSGIDVRAHDRPAALHEIARHGTAHGAKADDADAAS